MENISKFSITVLPGTLPLFSSCFVFRKVLNTFLIVHEQSTMQISMGVQEVSTYRKLSDSWGGGEIKSKQFHL